MLAPVSQHCLVRGSMRIPLLRLGGLQTGAPHCIAGAPACLSMTLVCTLHCQPDSLQGAGTKALGYLACDQASIVKGVVYILKVFGELTSMLAQRSMR